MIGGGANSGRHSFSDEWLFLAAFALWIKSVIGDFELIILISDSPREVFVFICSMFVASSSKVSKGPSEGLLHGRSEDWRVESELFL
jgi:hypothetical protein